MARSLGVPLGKHPVVSLAIARIADALLRKALRPGDYLPSETELAKTLGIGKSRVREAVKMLQAMGVVELRRSQGTVVRRHPGPDYLSPLVIRIGETNFQLFKPSISVSMQHVAPRAVQDHRRIFDAFRSGDAVQLRTAVLKRYDGWKECSYRAPERGDGVSPLR